MKHLLLALALVGCSIEPPDLSPLSCPYKKLRTQYNHRDYCAMMVGEGHMFTRQGETPCDGYSKCALVRPGDVVDVWEPLTNTGNDLDWFEVSCDYDTSQECPNQ